MRKSVKTLVWVAACLSFCMFCIGFARLQDDLTVEGDLDFKYVEAVLVPGTSFNSTVKAQTPNATKIIFELNNTNSSDNIAGLTFKANLDVGNKGLIRLYVSKDGKTVYVFSDRTIYANPSCTSMFNGMSTLSSVEFKSANAFNTSRVTNMSSMFNGCSGLTSLDVTKFDTSKVTNMSNMFNDCGALTSLDVSSFKTSNVTTMEQMFRNCSGLINLNVTKLNTAKVTNMNSMFDNCKKLTNLNLSSFNTSSLTTMGSIFGRCSGLTSLDLSKFNTSKVWNMGHMFANCSSLVTIYVGNGWSIAKTNVNSTKNMFLNCTNLVGGKGTKFSSTYINNSRAIVDGGTAKPGYLTLKQ